MNYEPKVPQFFEVDCIRFGDYLIKCSEQGLYLNQRENYNINNFMKHINQNQKNCIKCFFYLSKIDNPNKGNNYVIVA